MSEKASSPQSISLPKGGGAINGIGETFQPNLFTGTGNFSVPIFTSPGREGFGPKLTLQYSTGNRNGPFGMGWQLSLPRISLKTEKGLPTYTDQDVFVMSGAEDLVPVTPQPSFIPPAGYTVTYYHPRTEGLFARIAKWVKNDDIHWRATTKENVTSIYGKSTSARIVNPKMREQVFEWLLEETFDAKGNHMLYEYIQESSNFMPVAICDQNRKYSQAYLRRILYGNTPGALGAAKKAGHEREGRHYVFEVLFDYGDLPDRPPIPYDTARFPNKQSSADWPVREDPFSNFRAGFEVRTLRRCKRVLMLHHFKEGELASAPLVKSTDFNYEIDKESLLSFLSSVTVVGYRKDPGDDKKYLPADMPPVTFKYSKFKPQEQRYKSVAAKTNDFPPRALNDPNFIMIDLFGDGLPDILNTTSTGYFYWRNLGNATVDQRHLLHAAPASFVLGQSHVAVGDMGGDGLADIVVKAPSLSGFYEATPDGNWKAFKHFESMPSFNLADPNVRLVDLTGDGLSDVFVTRERHFLWFQCLGEKGYGEPRVVERRHNLDEFPDVNFADPAGRVRLADMTGDGLNDIVLVHDGRIDYWPNLGYGRFARRITMKDAPRIGRGFDPKRLFLVDLDGSGCADIVYVDFDRVHFWFNRSGNGWSEKQTIYGTPPVHDLSSVQFADFFGTGTATLLWSYDYNFQSGGNYKVLDFCGGIKPHLLIEMSNNMGATTRAQYAPSTKFYLEDRENGTPWVTALPFPVQLLEKTEVIDHISKTKLVTTYKYHHGYYDGREREFRGFGRVDQYNTEEFETFSGASLLNSAEFTNIQKAFHVPPVLTKTWFHTGVYFDENIPAADGRFYDQKDMMEAYKKEFYKEDTQAFALDDHVVETGDTPHEAYRALRGSILRSEIYAQDGTDRARHPYSVAETRHQVRKLQPRNGKHHAVYLVTQRERISYHYERNPDDPRITHQLTLQVDDFGNVTDSTTIGYPRRKVPQNLDEQGEIKIIYSKSDFINKSGAAGFYYVGNSCQTRSYEVTGINWVAGQSHLKVTDCQAILDSGIAPGNFKPYGWNRPRGHIGVEKRILKWIRSYFRKDSASADLDIDPALNPVRTLTNRLALGQIESLGLPYESYQAVFTNDLLREIFDGPNRQPRVVTNMINEGGYHVEPDLPNHWWIPSGQQAFDANKFYISEKSRDLFGSDSLMQFDDYGLLAVDLTDKVKNLTKAENDYRVLQPFRVTDPNKNVLEVAFDALGMVVGTAVRGQDEGSSSVGDSLAGFNSDLKPNDIESQIADPLNNPQDILKKATTRLIYDLKQYVNQKQPNVVYTLARETHHSDEQGQPTKIQHGFIYSDGFGREIQTKVQVEPDQAVQPPRPPRWVGTGTKVFNNKGKAVQQFEPFFSNTHQFGIEKHGISPILFYDPLDRVVCTLHPNHTYEKVALGPWLQKSWDANDTIHPNHRFNPQGGVLPDHTFNPMNDPDVGAYLKDLSQDHFLPTWYDLRVDPVKAQAKWHNTAIRDAEKRAAEKAAKHAATPSVSHLDVLGRAFLTIADNGKDKRGSDLYFETRIELDIEGNDLTITDPRGIKAFEHAFDMAGRKCWIDNIDAGMKLVFFDAIGNPLYAWDAKGHLFYTKYDALRRPIEQWVRKPGDSNYFLAQKTFYGEGKPRPEVSHHRGEIWKVYDGAGLLENESFDFKGNLKRAKRNLLKNGLSQVEWAGVANPASHFFNEAAAAALIDASQPGTYTVKTDFDAFNRIIRSETPDGTAQVFLYDKANLLNSIKVVTAQATKPLVEDVDYNARGQRTEIKYANGVVTNYIYDPETFRLSRIDTKRGGRQNPKDLQNLKYIYDPVGNITEIRDDAHVRIFNHNNVVDSVCKYTYDAVYRLIEASGREHEAMTACHYRQESKKQTEFIQLTNQPINNGRALSNYIEKYEYDASGNITLIDHTTLTRNLHWMRDQSYDGQSNRLKSSNAGCADENTFDFLRHHDANGNIIGMPHLPDMKWNHQNQLVEVQLSIGPNPNKAYYQYDASGQRVRKTVTKNGKIEERIYIGAYEIYTERNGGGVTFRRDTVHIFDDQNRNALIEEEKKPADGTLVNSRVRYRLSNHLGSSQLEVDDSSDAKIILYEEYYPYGETAYIAGLDWNEVSKGRYRYTGKERDDESGLNYYGARYYAPWLTRWLSADPIGIKSGFNLYLYSVCNPVNFSDRNGLQESVPIVIEEADVSYTVGEMRSNQYLAGRAHTFWQQALKVGDKESAEYWKTELEFRWTTGKRENEINWINILGATYFISVISALTGMAGGAVAESLGFGVLGQSVVGGAASGAGSELSEDILGDEVLFTDYMVPVLFGGAMGFVSGGGIARLNAKFWPIKPAPTPVNSNNVEAFATVTRQIKYSSAMRSDPSHANFLRASIEWVQEGERSLLAVSSRSVGDAAARSRARAIADALGFNRSGTHAMHPVDSKINPFFNPETGAYYFGNARVNMAFGGSIGNATRGLPPGTPIRFEFIGFPGYDVAPPIAPPVYPR